MAEDTTPTTPTEGAADDDDKRIYKVVTMSAELRDALEAAAEKSNVSVAAFARKAIADALGYDLSSEPTTTRRVKHATAYDKMYAHRIASYKASLLRSTAWNIQKAKVAKKAPAEVAKLEALLSDIMSDDNWTPPADVLAKIEKSVREALGKAAAEPTPAEELERATRDEFDDIDSHEFDEKTLEDLAEESDAE